MQFYDVEEAPFRIHGVFKENGMFRRMPEAVASMAQALGRVFNKIFGVSEVQGT